MAQTYRHIPDDTMDGYGKRSRTERRIERHKGNRQVRDYFAEHMQTIMEGKNNVQD